MLGFHLAYAFHKQKLSAFQDTVRKTNEIVKAAKTQFTGWCCSFKRYLDNQRVAIRLFDGDASVLCHELQIDLNFRDKHGPRAYNKPWSSRPLLLDGNKSPTLCLDKNTEAFDVIDTSNLCDHIGLINMLTATTPLLRKKAYTILYTETLLVASENIHERLSTVLGLVIATFSFLIGIAPVGLLSGVTLEAVGNEVSMFTFAKGDKGMTQCRMRIPWKRLVTTQFLLLYLGIRMYTCTMCDEPTLCRLVTTGFSSI